MWRPQRQHFGPALDKVAEYSTFALFCAVVLTGCTQEVNLQTGLHDTDANEIVALLSRYGIEVQKLSAKEGVTLAVKDNEIARATELMQDAGLPQRSRSNLGEVFKKEGMISTPLEERIRYLHGLSEELEETLQKFDNVISARVHVVLPERIAPGEPIQPSSAAVFIKYREPFDADSNTSRIRSLVAGSIPGLSNIEDRSKVTVVFAQAMASPQQVSWEAVGPFRVESQSAALLRQTLAILVLAAASGIFGVLVIALMRFPKTAAVLTKLLPKRIVAFIGSGQERGFQGNQ